jgi:tetratricopeptide (TPR) repeat protein
MNEEGSPTVRVSSWKVIYLRIGLVVSVALILFFGEVARGESGDDLFSQGMKAYENGDFQLSIDKLSKAVHFLKGDRERIDALKTMAFAYMAFLKAFLKKEEARQQFCNILELDPTFKLDPIMTPPKILAVLGEAKERCLPYGGIEVQAFSGNWEVISGAQVYLDGELIGETPLRKKDILPGEYELKVYKDGFRSFEARVSIEERILLEVKGTLIEVRIPTIKFFGHDVTAPLVARDTIEMILIGDSGNTAVYDLGDVKKNLPMQEISPGRYVGIYRVGEKDQFSDLAIIGYLKDQHGIQASAEAEGKISTSPLSRSQLLFRRGKASMERGEYDLAIDSLSKALYEDPDFVDAHILLAKAYNEKKGAYLESVKYLKNAIELETDNLEALSLLAKVYIENGKYEDALPVVKKILVIAPNSGFAHAYMGEILLSKRKYGGAIEALRKSLHLDQGNARVYFLLGKVFERLDRLADAVFEYETAVELSPTTYEYRNALAIVYKTLEQEMSAFRQWEKCLELGDLTELERKKVKRSLSELRR